MASFMSLARSAIMLPAFLLIGSPIVEAQQAPAIVRMTDELKFNPQTISVMRGQSIEWRNTSKVMHTVTADPKLANNADNVALPRDAQTFHSGNIQPGETYTQTFTVRGRYRYVCLPHERAGMIGEIIVK